MTIEYDVPYIICDHCGVKLIDGDNVYCETCVSKLQDENDELRETITELEEKLKERFNEE